MNLSATDWNWSEQWFVWLALLALLSVQFALTFRVIMRRRSVGESLSWILVIFVFPLVGPLAYLMIGELRLGERRVRRFIELFPPFENWLNEITHRQPVSWSSLGVECEPLARLASSTLGLPTQPGNQLELIGSWQEAFEHLLADIEQAQSICHLEFYIWHEGGKADEVAEALIRACKRGVLCRVLLDAIGSRSFLKSDMADKMIAAGIQLQPALAGGLLRALFVRFDLRMHRKIVIVDGEVAYTGSLNMVDPRYFKKDAGVGQWVDAMVRVRGPAVEALATTFLADWYVETDSTLDDLRQNSGVVEQFNQGDCAVQVLPSGPASQAEAIENVLLMAVYAARHELVLTTPYFVPSESLRIALATAARRGVKVILVVPAKVDSLLVRYASQAFKGDLLRAGVRIANFKGGLLHTKSISVDGEMSIFGSLNLDPRSMRLNFEISLGVYDAPFASQLRELQQRYIDQSELMDLEQWQNRPQHQKFAENCTRLLGPLL